MTDKIAVVTGGSLGLGREVARNLMEQGYKVAIFGRGKASLDAAKADLGDVLPIAVDVADSAAVADAFAEVDRQLGPVGTLINNAGMFMPFAIEDATPDRVELMAHINFCGPIYCMREAVARMRTLGGGDIVNVSSESVRRSTPFFTVYTATKAALESVTLSMGEELREEGIRLLTFRVGRMNSEGARNQEFSPELLDRFMQRVQMTGAGHWTGEGMEPKTAADALVRTLLTERDARIELVELRSR